MNKLLAVRFYNQKVLITIEEIFLFSKHVFRLGMENNWLKVQIRHISVFQ